MGTMLSLTLWILRGCQLIGFVILILVNIRIFGSFYKIKKINGDGNTVFINVMDKALKITIVILFVKMKKEVNDNEKTWSRLQSLENYSFSHEDF